MIVNHAVEVLSSIDFHSRHVGTKALRFLNIDSSDGAYFRTPIRELSMNKTSNQESSEPT